MADADNIPNGLTKEEDNYVKSLLDFFQDSENKINIDNKDSLMKHGGIIGMSAVYIVNGIDNIFKDVDNKKNNNNEKQRKDGLGWDIATIGAGVASALLEAGGAIAGLITTFRPETLDAVQDMMIALYKATATAYSSPTFAKMYSYVLVTEKAAGLVAGLWKPGSRAVIGFTNAISKGIEEVGKVIMLSTNPDAREAFKDMVVAQYRGMAKAYQSEQYAKLMGYILAVERGAGVVSAMTNTVTRTIKGFASSLESVTESVGKAVFLATNKDAQSAFIDMTIAQYEGMAKAYRSDTYAQWMSVELVGERVLGKIAQFTNPVTAIVAGASACLETLTESVGKTIALATDSNVQASFKSMISAQYEGMSKAYLSDAYANAIVPSLVAGDGIKNMLRGVTDVAVGTLGDLSSTIGNGMSEISSGISNTLSNLGKGLNGFFRNTFNFGKTEEEKLREAQNNLIIQSYSNPSDEMINIVNKFAIDGLKAYMGGFDVNDFLKEDKGWLRTKWEQWFGGNDNKDVLDAQKEFVKNTFIYLANKAKSGEILATNEFYYNKGAIGQDYNTYVNSKNVSNNLNYVEKHNTDGLLKGILSELKSINENVSQVQFNNVNNVMNYSNGQFSEVPSVLALQ